MSFPHSSALSNLLSATISNSIGSARRRSAAIMLLNSNLKILRVRGSSTLVCLIVAVPKLLEAPEICRGNGRAKDIVDTQEHHLEAVVDQKVITEISAHLEDILLQAPLFP